MADIPKAVLMSGPVLDAVRDYCALVAKSPVGWTASDLDHVADLFAVAGKDEAVTIFMFMDEQPGHWMLGSGDYRSWHVVLRQMRNNADSRGNLIDKFAGVAA